MEGPHAEWSITVVTPRERWLLSREEVTVFEAVQFIERRDVPGPDEKVLGEFLEEIDAIESARTSRAGFIEGSDDYAW
jgi:hypothetical protein